MGIGDLGSGEHPHAYAETPNINQLMASGTTFARAYVNSYICIPSRVSYMTGRYPFRYGSDVSYINDHGFSANEPLVTRLLHRAGYRTFHVGKWHIGPQATLDSGEYGFDQANVSSFVNRSFGLEFCHEDLESRQHGKDHYVLENALAMLDSVVATPGSPFYLQVWSRLGHAPVCPPISLAERYDDVDIDVNLLSPEVQDKFQQCADLGYDPEVGLKRYLVEIYSLDLEVGQLVAKIAQLGLEENTIVIFSSDHGPAPVRELQNPQDNAAARSGRCDMMGSPGPFSGGKHDLSEGGLRVPLVVKWPGRIRAGHVNRDTTFAFVDFLPTLAALADVPADEVPTDIDGVDMSAVWLGTADVRFRNGSYLCWRKGNRKWAAMLENWKIFVKIKLNTGTRQMTLYNVDMDPSEEVNLFGTAGDEHPMQEAAVAALEACETIPVGAAR